MSESESEQSDGRAGLETARALTTSVRRNGEGRSVSGTVIGGALVVVLVGACAVGVGALVSHNKEDKKTNVADSSRAAALSRSSAPKPGSSPIRPAVPLAGGPVAPGGTPAGKGTTKNKSGGPAKSAASQHPGSTGPAAGGSTGAGSQRVQALAAAASYSIVSYASGRCMDVSGGGRANAQVQVWSCTGASWQKWTFTSGTIRSGGQCLTAAGGSANGTRIVASACNGGTAQRFVLNGSSDIVHSGTSECVDVQDAKTDNGTPLQLWKCSGSSNQKWHTA